MAGKTRSRNLPSYGMIGSAAVRQNEGLGAAGVELLREGGCLDEDELEEDSNPLDSPIESMDALGDSPESPPSAPESPPSAPEPPPVEPTPPPDPQSAEEEPATPRRRRSTTRRSKGTRPAPDETRGEANAGEASPATERKHKRKTGRAGVRYKLPPPTRGETVSCHFRLPEDVDQHLSELAGAHGCTRTHVVCAVIESAWKGLDRKKPKPASAGGKAKEPQPSG